MVHTVFHIYLYNILVRGRWRVSSSYKAVYDVSGDKTKRFLTDLTHNKQNQRDAFFSITVSISTIHSKHRLENLL